jgi:hypothetical protein
MKHALFSACAAAWALGFIAISVGVATAASSSPPDAATAAAFYLAGGTPGNFSSIRALNAAIGEDAMTAEVAKLRTQYGSGTIDQFQKVFDFAMNDGWERAGQNNVAFPSPAPTLAGTDLTNALLQAATASDGTLATATMLNNLLTPTVHGLVMSDIATKFGPTAGSDFHKIGNQLLYDIAQKAGNTSLKLNVLH